MLVALNIPRSAAESWVDGNPPIRSVLKVIDKAASLALILEGEGEVTAERVLELSDDEVARQILSGPVDIDNAHDVRKMMYLCVGRLDYLRRQNEDA